jgi:hypothetical protein
MATGRALGPKRFVLMIKKAFARPRKPCKLGAKPKNPAHEHPKNHKEQARWQFVIRNRLRLANDFSKKKL